MQPSRIKLQQYPRIFSALQALLAASLLVSCSLVPSLQPLIVPVSPTQVPSEATSILENSKRALLAAKTLRMESVWVFPTSTTVEKITFVSPDRCRVTMTPVCSNGAEWESVQIGLTSYTRCPPNAWRSSTMHLDPPHIRIVNTYWNIATPVGTISRKAMGTKTLLSIQAEFSRLYNGSMETGTISFLIELQTFLPYKLEIERVYQEQKAVGTIEFSDFNLPMTIAEPTLQ